MEEFDFIKIFIDFRYPSVGIDCLVDTVVDHDIHVWVSQRNVVRCRTIVFRCQQGRPLDERIVVYSHKKAHAHAEHHISRE